MKKKEITESQRMQEPDGTVHIVQKVQQFLPVKSLSGPDWISGETRFELLDGKPLIQTSDEKLATLDDELSLQPLDA
ncbi:MAG: hypothetical protein AAF291_11375 [Pseudomonadota bacterium]